MRTRKEEAEQQETSEFKLGRRDSGSQIGNMCHVKVVLRLRTSSENTCLVILTSASIPSDIIADAGSASLARYIGPWTSLVSLHGSYLDNVLTRFRQGADNTRISIEGADYYLVT